MYYNVHIQNKNRKEIKMTNDDKMTLVSLIGIIEKLDDGSKKYIMGVADGMSFCNMQKEKKEKKIEKAS